MSSRRSAPRRGSLAVGDRVVIPFNISCGTCWMCSRGLFAQCETTQVRDQGTGASLFGYSKLYGQVPGGQARVPAGAAGAVRSGRGPRRRRPRRALPVPVRRPADRLAGASSTPRCPTAAPSPWWGSGPIGQMAARIAAHRGASRVIGLDLVPERLAMARRHGIDVIDVDAVDDVAGRSVSSRTAAASTPSIDAVGMEAHGSPVAAGAQRLAGLLPDARGRAAHREGRRRPARGPADGVRRGPPRRDGVDRRRLRRRGRPAADDGRCSTRALTLRMGQANVKRWIDDLLPLVSDAARPAGRARPAHPPRLAGGRARGLRDVPEEGGRLHQGRPRPVAGVTSGAPVAHRAGRATVNPRLAPEPGGCTHQDGSRP